jgi:hypothetical protein
MEERMVIAAQPDHLQVGIGRVVPGMMDLGLWVIADPARQRLDVSARKGAIGPLSHPPLEDVQICFGSAVPTTIRFAGALLAGSAEATPHVVLAAVKLGDRKKPPADGTLLLSVPAYAVHFHPAARE